MTESDTPADAVDRGRMMLASLIAPNGRTLVFTGLYPRITNTPLTVKCERRECSAAIEIGTRQLEDVDAHAEDDYDLEGNKLRRLYCSEQCAVASRFNHGVTVSA